MHPCEDGYDAVVGSVAGYVCEPLTSLSQSKVSHVLDPNCACLCVRPGFGFCPWWLFGLCGGCTELLFGRVGSPTFDLPYRVGCDRGRTVPGRVRHNPCPNSYRGELHRGGFHTVKVESPRGAPCRSYPIQSPGLGCDGLCAVNRGSSPWLKCHEDY